MRESFELSNTETSYLNHFSFSSDRVGANDIIQPVMNVSIQVAHPVFKYSNHVSLFVSV